MTTGVQKITAELFEVGCENATITCHFLPRSRADGCLVQWREQGSRNDSSQVRTLQIERQNGSSEASGVITNLQPNTAYTIEAFSTIDGEPLHDFGITLQESLTTRKG